MKRIPVYKFNRHKYGDELLVDEYYLTESGVDFYAEKLCVTPGHLRRLVRQSLGQSTKQYIQKRRIQEAKRLLQYTE